MDANGYTAEKRFPTTRWSLVARAGLEDAEGGREALGQLLSRYWPAMHAHLTGDKRLSPQDAEDILQEFIVGKILEKQLIARASEPLGKFRTFLLTALDRFLIDQFRQRHAEKRNPQGGATLDLGDYAPQIAAPQSPSDAFDAAWARGVLNETIERMRAECQAAGRPDIWGVFECRILNPMLHGAEPADYDQLVTQFGLQSPSQASNVLMTAKRTFARMLRGVVGEYAESGEDVETEIGELQAILGRAGG